MHNFFRLALALPLLAISYSTATPSMDDSELTQGNVQMYPESGVSTKSDVLDTFGSPNITLIITFDDTDDVNNFDSRDSSF